MRAGRSNRQTTSHRPWEHDVTVPRYPVKRWDCTLLHTEKRDDKWTRGDREIFGIVVAANGVAQLKMRCTQCGRGSGPLPLSLIKVWGLTWEDIEWIKHNEPFTDYPPCVVRDCATIPTEYHHFAPWNTFGVEADLWPVLPLCRPHHVEWHQRMDGYRWQARSTA